jgi:aspartyl protease family protein
MNSNIATCTVAVLVTLAPSVLGLAADEKEAKKTLEAKGIRVSSTGLTLADEANLSKGLRDAPKLRKAVVDAENELALREAKLVENKQAITRLTQLNVQLNAQLTVATDNETRIKLIGANNANAGQIRLLEQSGEQIAEQLKAARAKSGDAREKYIQTVLDMRRLADAISDRYKTLATDADVKAALAELSEARSKTLDLAESRSFQSFLQQLKRLEETVLSESIPLRREGRTLYVSVVLDGKHTQEMVLDSGANLISLPRDVAMKCGIEIKSSDPAVILELADGSRIRGNRVTLHSVRIGQFTVENVECAVLGPEAVKAVPLLGMSFLGNFKFEVNAEKGTLTMVKVETPGQPSTKSTARPKSGK